MRYTLLIFWTLALVVLCSSLNSLSQEEFVEISDSISEEKNALFAEIFGGGGYYSFGYERTIINYKKYELSSSIGLTSLNFKKPRFSFGFPLSINNRFKFWNFNGVDLGFTLGNFLNVWAMIDQDKHFNCPTGECIPPLRFLPSFHTGWVFRLNKFNISPRFYGFLYSFNNRLKVEPFFGLRGSYSF